MTHIDEALAATRALREIDIDTAQPARLIEQRQFVDEVSNAEPHPFRIRGARALIALHLQRVELP